MRTNKWYISLQLNQYYKITVYANGIVYGPNRGEKLFQLNEETMTKIRTIIEKVRPFLAKNKRCLKNRKGKFNIFHKTSILNLPDADMAFNLFINC